MFPERLKKLRKEKGMTQLDLAAALNVSSGTVAMWETGKRKPSFDMFDKLTEVFDKRIDYILGATDDPAPATLSNNDITQLGEWVVQEEYEDIMRKYSLLDAIAPPFESCLLMDFLNPFLKYNRLFFH